jgi:tRNA G18 (ribose-2'-O)-methylase SpoU
MDTDEPRWEKLRTMHLERVTALDRPELAPYATLRQHEEHKRAGIFVAEGDKVVRRLLESHFGVVSVLLPERRLAEFEPLLRARREDVSVYVMEIAELEKLTGFPFFQGVLAIGKVPQAHTLESVLASMPRPHFFVAIDGLTNAENVGLIVRNCAAFGVQALLVDNSSASPFLRRAVRNSMGTIFKLPVVETDNIPQALGCLRGKQIRVIAAHPHAEKLTVHDTNFAGDTCLVFGSEGPGLSPEVLKACDEAVTIPMSDGVDSLNVGSAAAVFLYEAAGQRERKRS